MSLQKKLIYLLCLFPYVIIFFFFCFFSYFSWNYTLIVDDFQFQEIIKNNNSILSSSIFYYENFNGRLASHFFLFTIFRIFQGHENLFFMYHLLMMAGFVISLSHFLQNYLTFFRKRSILFRQSLYWSLFITSFLFFFFFAGRTELWFWVSATGVYLISFILALNAFAIALKEHQTIKSIILSTFLFFLSGGFSESYALMYILLLSYFILKQKSLLNKKLLLSAVLGIAFLTIALVINVLSSGIHNRLGWLPEFRFLYAIKNTLHSLAIPFLRYKHFPFVAALTIIFFLFSRFEVLKSINQLKLEYSKVIMLLIFIFIAFFIPCYLLSDIVPDRAASIGYLAGVLFLFDHFIFMQKMPDEELPGIS